MKHIHLKYYGEVVPARNRNRTQKVPFFLNFWNFAEFLIWIFFKTFSKIWLTSVSVEVSDFYNLKLFKGSRHPKTSCCWSRMVWGHSLQSKTILIRRLVIHQLWPRSDSSKLLLPKRKKLRVYFFNFHWSSCRGRCHTRCLGSHAKWRKWLGCCKVFRWNFC